MDLRLDGRVVLVTGGSRGIGRATVRLLCGTGARVVFSYNTAQASADALAEECGGPETCRALQQPLHTAEDGHALVAAAAACFGRLDDVIVNHGVWPAHAQPISTMTATQWRDTLGINLDSVFGVVSAATAVMLQQPAAGAHPRRKPFGNARPRGLGAASSVRGHIVLVASTAAQRGEAFHADYAASKGALVSLTKSLSSELAPQGILCNCVAPGWVHTDMAAETLADPAASKAALAPIPLGRAAEPQEIAGPIVFLLTPWAGFISGEIFNVNGGAVLVG